MPRRPDRSHHAARTMSIAVPAANERRTQPGLLAAAAATAAVLLATTAAHAQTVRFSGGDRDGVQRARSVDAFGARARFQNPVSPTSDGSTLRSRDVETTIAERDRLRARLWFNERETTAFARALPFARRARGGSVVVFSGDDDAFAGPYAAIRPRTDGFIFNPEPAGRRGVVTFRGSDAGSVRIGGGGQPFVINSPTGRGAPPQALDQIIWVRTRDHLPPIAISPWQEVTDETIDELFRAQPFLRSSNPDDLLEDFRNARRQWLRENGYLSPRTFTGRDRDAGMRQAPHGAASTDQLLRERRPADAQDQRPTTLSDDSFIRVRPANGDVDDDDQRDRNADGARDDAGDTDAANELGEDSFIRINDRRTTTTRPTSRV